jgi:hypothetical protein
VEGASGAGKTRIGYELGRAFKEKLRGIVNTVGYVQVVFDQKIVSDILDYFPGATARFAASARPPKGPQAASVSQATFAPQAKGSSVPQAVPDQPVTESVVAEALVLGQAREELTEEEKKRKEADLRMGDKKPDIELADRILAVMIIHATKDAFDEVVLPDGSVKEIHTSKKAKRTLVLKDISLATLIPDMLDKKGPTAHADTNTSRVVVLQLDEYQVRPFLVACMLRAIREFNLLHQAFKHGVNGKTRFAILPVCTGLSSDETMECMSYMEEGRSLTVSGCNVLQKTVPYFGDVTKVGSVWTLFLNAYMAAHEAIEGRIAEGWDVGERSKSLMTAHSTFAEAPLELQHLLIGTMGWAYAVVQLGAGVAGASHGKGAWAYVRWVDVETALLGRCELRYKYAMSSLNEQTKEKLFYLSIAPTPVSKQTCVCGCVVWVSECGCGWVFPSPC